MLYASICHHIIVRMVNEESIQLLTLHRKRESKRDKHTMLFRVILRERRAAASRQQRS